MSLVTDALNKARTQTAGQQATGRIDGTIPSSAVPRGRGSSKRSAVPIIAGTAGATAIVLFVIGLLMSIDERVENGLPRVAEFLAASAAFSASCER